MSPSPGSPDPRPLPAAAYAAQAADRFRSSELTRGPWDPSHQHAGPPIALAVRAVEALAGEHGLAHVARFTANLLRPVPIAELTVAVAPDYVGRSAGHFSGSVVAEGKEVMRFTALAQRESPVELPETMPGHPLPLAPATPAASPAARFPFAGSRIGYADLMAVRLAGGEMWNGPCAVWFRMERPLVEGESPSPYQRVVAAADSGNGISASLDYQRYLFVNSDLTVNLLRRPVGEWICIEARSAFGSTGGGLAESALYDEQGLIGRATQSLALRMR